eukprot:3492894-Rhodomonas_salina.1
MLILVRDCGETGSRDCVHISKSGRIYEGLSDDLYLGGVKSGRRAVKMTVCVHHSRASRSKVP